MPKKSLRPCKQPGCPNLVQTGYCENHRGYSPRKRFEKLDERKNPTATAFYRTYKWKRTSLAFLDAHPLCERCYSRGHIQKSELSHHDPELLDLLSSGLNPFSWDHLHAICKNCHLEDLRNKPRTTPNIPRT